MKIWTAHLRPDKPPVLLREGFSWAALVFGPFWLLAHRAWIPGFLALAAQVAITLLADDPIRGVLLWGLLWSLGLWGNDLRRWTLTLRGYTMAHVVAARDSDTAFLRLLSVRPDLGEHFLPAGHG